jgi:hypothetical protein
VSDGGVSKPHFSSMVKSLESGVVVSGCIIKMQEVIKELSAIRKQVSLPFVFFTIPDEISYIFSVTVPYVRGSELADAISFVMEENVPHPSVMRLRYHLHVAFAYRAYVHNRQKFFIFINFFRRDLALHYFAKNAVFHK